MNSSTPVGLDLEPLNHVRPFDHAAATHPQDLMELKLQVEVCVGRLSLPLSSLLDAREGDVHSLDAAVDAPVDLLVDGVVIARGFLVAVDDQFAIQITERAKLRSANDAAKG